MSAWPVRQCKAKVSFEEERVRFGRAAAGGEQQLRAEYSLLLRSVKSVAQGQLLQARIQQDRLQDDSVLKGLLIQVYGKCGSLCDACTLFDSIPERPMLAWKSIIRAYVQNGDCLQTLQLFQQLLQEGFVPDKYTFVSVLTASANITSLACGRQFHAVLVTNSFSSDIAVGTALVNMYGKCDSITACIEMFQVMHSCNIIGWNILIAVHVKSNEWDIALSLFYRMHEEGVLPNRITFITILNVDTATCNVHEKGQKMHATLCTREYEVDVVLGNALLSMYCKSGSLVYAFSFFDGLLTQNQVSWTTMIEAYNQQGHSRKAFQCFKQMQEQGILPDRISYISILETCANMGVLLEGKRVHAQLAGINLESSLMIETALMQMYGACGCVKTAKMLFNRMTHLNLLAWTSLIALESQHEEGARTFPAFKQMLQEGFLPDKVVFFCVLDACNQKMNVHEGKYVHSILVGAGYELDDNARLTLHSLYLSSRNLEEARRSFDTLSHMDIASWTSMIATYTKHGRNLEALQLFCQMEQEGILPEELLYVNVLSCCSNMPSLFNGQKIHIYVTQAKNNSVEAPLTNMYSKCGDLNGAEIVFNGAVEHNFVSWSALLAAYVRHGESRKALQVFKIIATQNLNLDECTLLQALLACCRSGLVDEAFVCCLKMVHSHPTNIGLDHFCCIIDLSIRAGLLQCAEAFSYAIPCQPSVALWMVLLGTCQQRMNVQCAEGLARYVSELNEIESRHYVVLSNVYASAGRTEDQHEENATVA